MDDYIMISKSKDAVLHFLQKSHQKFKLYGGRINPAKTRYSFILIITIIFILIIEGLILMQKSNAMVKESS
jgi:hypothetical protein